MSVLGLEQPLPKKIRLQIIELTIIQVANAENARTPLERSFEARLRGLQQGDELLQFLFVLTRALPGRSWPHWVRHKPK